jgi:hypothetical protein
MKNKFDAALLDASGATHASFEAKRCRKNHLKIVLPILAIFLASTYAYATPASETIVGTFSLAMGKSGNSLEIVLECTTETTCTFTSMSKSDKSPLKDIQTLNNVRPVEKLIYATNALKYAIDHQSQTPRFPDAIESMNRLRPVLLTNPSISKCWDLNYPSPEHMLACTLSNTPIDSPSIFLFATLMANCDDVFCRYVINPMSRIK